MFDQGNDICLKAISMNKTLKDGDNLSFRYRPELEVKDIRRGIFTCSCINGKGSV